MAKAGRRRMTIGTRIAAIRLGAVACLTLVSACASAPPDQRPLIETPAAYKEAPEGSAILRPAQPNDAAPRRAWWELFGDSRLNDLEETLLHGNPPLAEADARWRQARALVRQDRAAYAPTIDLGASIERASTAGGHSLANISNPGQFSLGTTASWEPDFWGRVHETVAAGV